MGARVHGLRDKARRRTESRRARFTRANARARASQSEGQSEKRRYGSSEAAPTQCTAMNARAATALRRRTLRRERAVMSDRKRRTGSMPQRSAQERRVRRRARGLWTFTITLVWRVDLQDDHRCRRLSFDEHIRDINAVNTFFPSAVRDAFLPCAEFVGQFIDNVGSFA